MTFHELIGDHGTIILEISKKLLYGEDCVKVYPHNYLRLTGVRPEGVEHTPNEISWCQKNV